MWLEAFTGIWQLDRRIDDARADQTGRFTGEATFTPVPDGLAYVEDGELRLKGAAPMAASRRYLWRAARDGAIEILFADGGFFHRFEADDPAPAALHLCPPDRYAVRYDFRAWPRWTAEWHVQGPRKDYRMVSDYRQLDSGPGLRHEHR